MISSDGAYALSASWDKTLRLWELSTGTTTRRFVGHTNDVLSVSFSADNRQIVSGSRDRSIKLWNTLGDCKFTITDKGHTEWVSCVRFSPNPQNPVIVSAGWDKLVKVCDSDYTRFQPILDDARNFSQVFATSEPSGNETNTHALIPHRSHYIFESLLAFVQRLTIGIGLGTLFLQAPDRPHWPHWLYQHRHHFPRRISLRFWW